MVDGIQLKAKTNKELLIITVQALNELHREVKRLNGRVTEHEKRISSLELAEEVRRRMKESYRISFKQKVTIAGIILTFLGLIMTALGGSFHWW